MSGSVGATASIATADALASLLSLVVVGQVVDRFQWHIGTVAICAVAVEGVLVAVASRFDMWPVYVAAFGLMSAMVPLAANGLNGFLAVYTPNELQGRVFAAVGLCSSLIGVAAPGIVAALLSHAGGLGGTMIALSLVYVLAILTIVISPILRSIPSSKHWSEYIAQVKEVR
jgi:MFS family permease